MSFQGSLAGRYQFEFQGWERNELLLILVFIFLKGKNNSSKKEKKTSLLKCPHKIYKKNLLKRADLQLESNNFYKR